MANRWVLALALSAAVGAADTGDPCKEFSASVSSAASTFPAMKMAVPLAYFQIAAYVLYRNRGKM